MTETLTESARINWEAVERFTPELYYEYETAPFWEIDSPDFHGEADYHYYYTQFGKQLVITSKSIIGRWQSRGKEAARAIEQSTAATVPVFDFQNAIAAEGLPLAKSQIQEKVALLSSNPPQPIAMPQQEGQTQYVGALNQLMGMVYEDNNWPLLCSKGHYDIRFWNTACYKWTVDPFSPGPFGQAGKICLEKVALEDLFYDPQCKELDYRYMDYIVQRHVMEIGDIQAKYPLAGHLVSAEEDERISDMSVQARNNEDYIQSPQPKLARDASSRRQKITVYEMWIKDSRLKFQPKMRDPKAKTYKERFELDKDGYILGDWVKRYPDGRMILITGNVVLKDLANPYPHGQFPFVFPIGEPAELPYAEGDAMSLMIVTRKINNMIAIMHKYYQSEVSRPMHGESGWSMDPQMAQQVPNDPDYILEHAPGKALVRPQAMDVPPLLFTYLQLLQGVMDMVSGSSAVMRGQVADGAQMSAEALASLQQYASSRLALSATLFNSVIRQLGYQLMWILRGTIKEAIKCEVILPDGTKQLIDWESDKEVFDRGDPNEIQQLRARENYMITIKAGTGRPGAKDQQQDQALALWRERAIDRTATLDALEYPDRQNIIKRMRDQEIEDLEIKAFSKEIGVSASEQIKQSRPGRRTKD